jgi:uncharacterized protein YggU (UPF0235/DUF167 family)
MMARPMIFDVPGGATIDVKVIPRAGRSCVAGTRGSALLVRLSAAPVDGAANAELIALLARLLDLPKHRLTVLAGEKRRSKRVKVTGLAADQVRARFDALPHGR